MFYTDNPHRDFDRWIDEQETELAKVPDCVACGQKILTERFWMISGDIYCDKCARKEFTKNTDDYIAAKEEGSTF